MKPGKETQYAIAVALSLTTAAMGIFAGWSTPMVSKMFRDETRISRDAVNKYLSWMYYTQSLGYVLGCLITLCVCDRYGRRHTLIHSAVYAFCGTILAFTAYDEWMLHIMRVLWSISFTMVTISVTIYLAEMADPDIRGRLYAITKTLKYAGLLFVVGIGSLVSYRGFNFWQIFLPLLCFCACFKIPESPYFLVKSDRIDEARNALLILRKEDSVDTELEDIRSHVKMEMQSSNPWLALFYLKNLKAIFIVFGMRMIYMMSGVSAIQNYYFDFINDSDLYITFDNMFVIFLSVDCIGGLISACLVDTLGRRKLMILSHIGCSAPLTIVGAYYYLRDVVSVHPDTLKIFGLVLFIGIVISVFFACTGFYTLQHLFRGEMFPINVRLKTIVLLDCMDFIAYPVGKMLGEIESKSGRAGIVWFYSLISFIGAVFVFFMLPETKGKNLREIQELLHGAKRDENSQEMVNTNAGRNV